MLAPAHLKGLAIIAYAFGATMIFDGVALLLALGLGIVILSLVAKTIPQALAPRYRLERRRFGRVQVLAVTDEETTGRTAFKTRAAQMEAAGATGQLVLVEVATGCPLIWQVRAPESGDHSELPASAASTHTGQS